MAARHSNIFLDILSASIPVKSTAVAKKIVKVAPARYEYLSGPKLGIAYLIWYFLSGCSPKAGLIW
jgi:hypothetical protein